MHPNDAASARRVNPFEVALWIFGVAAVAASVWGAQWANRTLSLANGGYYCDDAGNCTERYDYVLTQTVLALAPALLTAGLIALVVALAIRAVDAVWGPSSGVTRTTVQPLSVGNGRFKRPPEE